MPEAIRRLLDLPFMPHGMCYLWQPWVVWMHVVSDILIALAYVVIPVALVHFIRRRRDVPFDWMFWCFGLFIVACGATHVMEVWNVWHANYLIAGGVKAVTAFASVPTAVLLVRLIPRALAIPSPAQLQRSEERFRMASRAGKMFAYEWDAVTDAVVRSGECEPILGVTEGETVTGQQVLSKVHPDDRQSLLAALEALSPEQPNLQISYRTIRPDGSVIWVERDSRGFFDEQGKLLRVVGMVMEITERKRIEQELHRLSHQLMRTQDTERRNVARELHESVGQTLAALTMSFGNVEYALSNKEDYRKDLLVARGLIEDAVREVRVISYVMHPPLLEDAGLGLALQWYVRGFSERSGVEVKLQVAPDLGRHSLEIETAIFRIVQEALTNVYRHSGSPIAIICLKREAQQIFLEIEDRGCGMPAHGKPEAKGILGVGIAGMRERVEQLAGSFHIESAPGCGTMLRITFPTGRTRTSDSPTQNPHVVSQGLVL